LRFRPTLLKQLCRSERGLVLPLAVAISCVLAITGTSVMIYTSAGSRSASYATSRQTAAALADAGVNNALAVVFQPGINPQNPYLFCSPGQTLPCPGQSATVNGNSLSWTGAPYRVGFRRRTGSTSARARRHRVR
jgi:hypothetical protein